jgi:hypothetical protein
MGRFRIGLPVCLLAVVLVAPRSAIAASLTLAWDPENGAAGFLVYYGTSSGNYTSSVDVGNATQKQIGNLANGTLYFFTVRAYDSSGVLGTTSIEVAGATSGTTSTPLNISCPTPSGTSFNGSPLTLNFSPTVSGGAAPVTSSCAPSSGSLFPIGATALTCTATDANARTASCQSAAIVTSLASALSITCPVIPPLAAISGNPVKVDFSPTVTGGVAPVTTTCSPSSGTLFPTGRTAVMCSAYDSLGHAVSCATSISVSVNPRPQSQR